MESIKNEIASICTFNIKNDPLIKAFSRLGRKSETKSFKAYGEICSALLSSSKTLGQYLHDMLIYSDSPFITECAANPTALQKKAVECDLAALSHLAKFTSAQLKDMLAKTYENDLFHTLPDFETGVFNYTASYFLRYAHKHGGGIFAKHKAFTYENGGLKPVTNPDPIRLTDLKKYEYQRNLVVENTICFLKNKPAQNVLLYGDRGTGKSSTIKAVLNEFSGLRMVELPKTSIPGLPELFETLRKISLHFIVTIDDLAFAENDERFSVLKAALEGSLSRRPDNVLIYATTNRRKIIKETNGDRSPDSIGRSDAVDESMSLADRFGLFITFTKPDREEYLEIIDRLAKDAKIKTDPDELHSAAERFALQRGGRSPRTAKQFIEWIGSRIALGMDY